MAHSHVADNVRNGVSSHANIPLSSYLPSENSLESFWQKDSHELSDFRSTPTLPTYSDVVIIGAGYAGVALAHHLLDNDGERPSSGSPQTTPSVTILEARAACSGATGRNGGHLKPDLYGRIPKYIDRAGAEAAAEIANFEIANMYAIKEVIEDRKIDCDFGLSKFFDVWCNKEAALKAQKVYDRMGKAGFEYMKDVNFTLGEKAEKETGVKGAQACVSYTAGHLWPYKFILSILKPLVMSGQVNLQTFTPATSVKPDSQHGWTVSTPRGTIFARRVVHASNAYVAGLLPQYKHNIIPVKGVCCHIAEPEDKSFNKLQLKNSYMNRNADNTSSYLVPRPDGGVIVGGKASQFSATRDEWYFTVDDSTHISGAEKYFNGYMQRTYTNWNESNAKITKLWTGIMGYSYDSLPHIGEVPGSPGQYVIAGFNGHGMPVIWLSAKGLAKLLSSERSLSFQDTGLPRLFETTQARIDMAKNNREEDGDILGSGTIFLPTRRCDV